MCLCVCVCVLQVAILLKILLFKEFSSYKRWYQWCYFSSEYFTVCLAFLLYWLIFQYHRVVINCFHQVFMTSIGMRLKQRNIEIERNRNNLRICVFVCMFVYEYTNIWYVQGMFSLVSLNTLSNMDVELNWTLAIFWYNNIIFIIYTYYINTFLAKPS